jgi:hypothetical protein
MERAKNANVIGRSGLAVVMPLLATSSAEAQLGRLQTAAKQAVADAGAARDDSVQNAFESYAVKLLRCGGPAGQRRVA